MQGRSKRLVVGENDVAVVSPCRDVDAVVAPLKLFPVETKTSRAGDAKPPVRCCVELVVRAVREENAFALYVRVASDVIWRVPRFAIGFQIDRRLDWILDVGACDKDAVYGRANAV